MIQKPTLEQSVALLSERDEYKVIIAFIREERDRFFSDLRMGRDPNDIMKIAGSISALDEMLNILDTRK